MSFVIVSLLNLAVVVLLARAILSWFRIGFDSPLRPVADFLFRITEPVLAPVRRVVPPLGGFDISFLVVLLAIRLLLVPAAQQLP